MGAMDQQRVRGSVAKQEALMQLLSSDPSLMHSFDDDLLASITLASNPNASAPQSGSSTAAVTRHTLIDPRMSYDDRNAGSASTSSGVAMRYASKGDRVNVHLYSEADTRNTRKQPNARAPKATAASEATSTMKTAATPAAVAETGSNGKKDGETRDRSNAVTREGARQPQKLVSLFDENLFALDQGKSTKASTPQPTPPSSGSAAASATPAASGAPASIIVKAKSMSPSKKSIKKAKANNRRRAQPTTVTKALTMEDQFEFGRTNSYGDDLSATESCTGSNPESSSHGSNQSDESSICMSSVSVQESSSVAVGSVAPVSSSGAATLGKQKSSHSVLDHRCFVARDQWVQKNTRRCCHVCEREFGVLRKRHSCRMCGEVICSRCSVFRAVNLSVVEGKCRICSCCSLSYRRKVEELVNSNPAADPQDRESISSSTSNTIPTPPNSSSEAPPSPPSPPPSSSTDPPSSLTASSLSNLAECTASLLSAVPSRCDSDLSTLLSASDCSFSSSSLSSSDLASFRYSSRNIEEELEAALKARQLEKEVEASRNRIQELEVRIQDQENQKDLLSAEQQNQLDEAREMISLLQEKLRQQEVSAREAAVTRDTICLTNLRQVEMYTNDDEESRALRQKLKILERQLQQAGINVAEVIPYEVAKAKVAEIAKRLQEIGSSEVVLDDKLAQAAARKEYYKLEQDMEKYNTALVMTDEYIEEERRKEALWEDENRDANLRALLLLRSAIPVDISRLSEQQLKALTTPSGVAFSADLAKRLKRTNVLQLLRVDPKDIVRMHPSVIEGYRTTGLTLLERRALHVVMQVSFKEWKRQQKDEMSQKKFQWYTKLRDALVSAVLHFNQHCEGTGGRDVKTHSCKLLGLSCPVKAEAKVEALYTLGLGFPATDVYCVQEVIKSDPEGAGEKALQEAQSYAREMIANQRQRELKTHYKMSMRQVAQAMGALEEMDAILERIKVLDDSFTLPGREGISEIDESKQKEVLSNCDSVLQATRELVLLLAKRAGICMVGKRNPENDEADTRSPLEVQAAVSAVELLHSLLDDIRDLYGNSSAVSRGTLRFVYELLEDVRDKNASAVDDDNVTDASSACKRVAWKERPTTTDVACNDSGEAGSGESGAAVHSAQRIPAADAVARPPVLPTSASLFDAIRTRRKQSGKDHKTATESSERKEAPASEETETQQAAAPAATKQPLDLFAAIRARQCKVAAAKEKESATSSTLQHPKRIVSSEADPQANTSSA